MKTARKISKKSPSQGGFYNVVPNAAKQAASKPGSSRGLMAVWKNKNAQNKKCSGNFWNKKLWQAHIFKRKRTSRKEGIVRLLHDDLTPAQIAVLGSVLAASVIALVAGIFRFIKS